MGSTVTLFLDGDELADEVPVSPEGTWTSTPSAPLTSGAYMLRATATDAAGNESEQTDEVGFVIVSPPVILDPSENEVVIPTPTISGKGTPGAEIRVVATQDGPTTPRAVAASEDIGTATVDQDGNWSFDVTEALDYGTYEVQAEQRFADEAPGAELHEDRPLERPHLRGGAGAAGDHHPGPRGHGGVADRRLRNG